MAGLVSCHAVEHPDAGPRANSGRPAPSFASFGAAAMASAGVTISAGHAFQPFSRAHTTQPRPRPAAGTAAPAAAPPPADAARSAGGALAQRAPKRLCQACEAIRIETCLPCCQWPHAARAQTCSITHVLLCPDQKELARGRGWLLYRAIMPMLRAANSSLHAG